MHGERKKISTQDIIVEKYLNKETPEERLQIYDEWGEGSGGGGGGGPLSLRVKNANTNMYRRRPFFLLKMFSCMCERILTFARGLAVHYYYTSYSCFNL